MKITKEDFISRFDFAVSLADLHLIPKLPGNYCFVSLDSDTVYNGSSIDVQERASQHIKGSHNKHLTSSIKLHGVENYLFCYSLCDRDDLLKIEQTHLDFGFNSKFKGFCNVAVKAGGGNLGPAAIAKISESWTDERKVEHSIIISKALTGRKHSAERKAAHSKKLKEYWTEDRKQAWRGSGNPMSGINGTNHPRADLTTYTFGHKDGRTFIGTRCDFCQKYGVKKQNLNALMCGQCKTTSGGWSLIK